MDITEKSKKSLEFDKISEKLANFAKLAQSKSLCLQIKPFNDITTIKRQLQYTREAKFILDIPNDIPIEFVADINAIKKNIGISYLEEEELIDVAKTLRTSRLVKNFIINNLEDNTLLVKLAQNLYSNKELEENIFDTFDENLNIRPDATPELKGLFSALNGKQSFKLSGFFKTLTRKHIHNT